MLFLTALKWLAQRRRGAKLFFVFVTGVQKIEHFLLDRIFRNFLLVLPSDKRCQPEVKNVGYMGVGRRNLLTFF